MDHRYASPVLDTFLQAMPIPRLYLRFGPYTRPRCEWMERRAQIARFGGELRIFKNPRAWQLGRHRQQNAGIGLESSARELWTRRLRRGRPEPGARVIGIKEKLRLTIAVRVAFEPGSQSGRFWNGRCS